MPMPRLQQMLTVIFGNWNGDQRTPVLNDDVDAPGHLSLGTGIRNWNPVQR